VRHITPPSAPFYIDRTQNFGSRGSQQLASTNSYSSDSELKYTRKGAACTIHVKFVVLDGGKEEQSDVRGGLMGSPNRMANPYRLGPMSRKPAQRR
jgi:hypothetical protein